MKLFIILLSKFIYWFGKLFGKGSSLPGKIALKLDRDILKKIKLPDNIIAVTGSNGKTSTSEMIYSVLKNAGFDVGCNLEGSNQTAGVATMILRESNLKGEVKKDVLVIESDERYLRHTLKHFKAKYLIVTNLYRDQMTRNGNPEIIYNIIKEAIQPETKLILNADDPLSSLYGMRRENVTYFGMNKTLLSKTENNSAYNDGKYCPNCKSPLKYDYYHFNHIGSYKCEKCGHSRKTPKYAVTNLNLETGEIVINDKYKIEMTLRSVYNAYNILATFAISKLFGIDEETIVNTLTDYIIKNDRVQSFDLNGHSAMLLTSKHENSISYNQSLSYVINQNKPCTVVVIVDSISRKYFTSETSWLWDIDFEMLASDCVKKIVLAGKYSNDLMVRFENSCIGMEKVIPKSNLDEMMHEVKENSIGDIYIVTCFSDRMKFLDRR